MKSVSLSLARVPEMVDGGDLASLFRSYGRYVACIAMRFLGRDEDVDDVVAQDVFLAAAPGLHTVRDPLAIRGWLATITVRMASRRLRWRRVRNLLSGGDSALCVCRAVRAGAAADQRVLIGQLYACSTSCPRRCGWPGGCASSRVSRSREGG